MNSLVGFFESVEKLAYKILLWIILIPKTLLRIIINPTWVPDYIKGELKQDKSPFDEYISPIILMLVVALLPALIFSILPKLDVTISSPAEKETTKDGILEFDAQANFISASVRAHDKYTWYVEKIDIGKDGNFTYDENGDYYHKIYTETYEYELAESNTSNDVFFYSFENKPGSYYVNVEVQRFDIDRLDVPIEEYFSYVFVYVPEKSEDLIQISQFDETSQDTRENKLTPENFADQLTKESTILLALLLLTPPLLFALATKVLTREEISENSLKENFYIQCYYFSPSSLAIWATIYGMHFYT